MSVVDAGLQEEQNTTPSDWGAANSEATFASLGLSDVSLTAIEETGFANPTPIQAGLIPLAIKGLDVIGQARTGTGKTASFLLPLFERLKPVEESAAPKPRRRKGSRSRSNAAGPRRNPQALVLVPTRELAQQVDHEAQKLAFGRPSRTVVLCGGKPMRRQMTMLEEGVDLVVGTPGRVIDHIRRQTLNLSDIHIVVLDEADRMLDIGFRPDIEKILRQCPQDRQTLLLSATVPPSVERLARRYMRDPEMVNRSPQNVSVDTIDQYYVSVEKPQKFAALVQLLQTEEPAQAIIFCRTKRGTDRICRELSKKFQDVSAIHGDMQQRVRDRVMAQFREGKIRYLVATDVMGRGIDVSGISHIVNYDIPEFCDDYVHRVGRTGRMGRSGAAYTLVTPEEGSQLTSVEVRINKLLERYDLAGFERPKPKVQPHHRQPEEITPGAARNRPQSPPAAEAPAEKSAEEAAPKKPARGRKRYRRAL